MIIQAESKGTKGGGEREKGGLRGGSSWLSEQERASAVLDCSTESEPSGPPISVSPTFSFQLKTQASRILVTFPRSPAHQRYTLCILSNEWLAQEHKEMLQEQLCVPGYKYCFQNQHILLLLLGLSSIYLGTLSHFPKVLGISYWENGSNLILIQVCFLFFIVSIYPQLFLASWSLLNFLFTTFFCVAHSLFNFKVITVNPHTFFLSRFSQYRIVILPLTLKIHL